MKKRIKRPVLQFDDKGEKQVETHQLGTEERALFEAKETRDKFLDEGKLPKEYLDLVRDLKEAVDDIRKREERTTARIYVPRLYETLREEGFSIEESREITVADVIDNGFWGYWSIIEYLPDEAKHAGRRRAGLRSAEERQKKGLALATPELRHMVAVKGAKALIKKHPGVMKKIGKVSGVLRTENAELKEEREEIKNQLEELKQTSVALPHRFVLGIVEIQDIVELSKTHKKIELELKTPTRVRILTHN